jgi:hypothetical protein
LAAKAWLFGSNLRRWRGQDTKNSYVVHTPE